MRTRTLNQKLNKNAWDVVPRKKWFVLKVHELPRGSVTYDVEGGNRIIFPPDKTIMVGPFDHKTKTLKEGLLNA